MKINFKVLILFLLVLNVSNGLIAQENRKNDVFTINGVVINETGLPVAGVVVTMDEGKSQFTTGTNGAYSFRASSKSKFLFEHPDYQEKLLLVEDLKNINYRVKMISKDNSKSDNVLVNIPYQIKEKNRLVGNVDVIDAQKEYERDSRSDIISALDGKISGSFGGINLNGLGNAFTVIDGIPMGLGNINLREVEQIVVLKDAISRLLYGVETDAPVVLITTKKGKVNKKTMQLSAERGLNQALRYPNFLDAASYMETYNKAYRNDGAVTDFYSMDAIRNTRDGVDPVLYPDNNYYGHNYIKNTTNYSDIFGTVSGGNEKVQYLLNVNWVNNQGWNNISNTVNNKFSVRGRVDFEVTKRLKMNSQVLASYNLIDGPNMGNYWTKANSLLPNAFVELIPSSRIANLESLPNYSLVNGQHLLGGTTIYQSTMNGDLLKSGKSSQMQRYVQSRIGFDFDFNGVIKGLSLKGAVGYDFYNTYKQVINNSYSVYEIDSINEENKLYVSQIGVDKITAEQSVNAADMNFNRSVKWNYFLDYNRTLGLHSISAIVLGYGSFFTQNDLNQSSRKLAFGGQVSYMFSDKYIVEGALISQSSMKVKPSEKFGYSKSIGGAWMMSNEDFLKANDLISYIKMRASFGQFVSDAFTSGKYLGYFLNEDLYSQSFVYQYNNGLTNNRQINIESFDNHVGWEKRNEFSAGIDVALFKNKLWFDATYLNSYSFDNLTSMDILSASTLGGVTSYANYNANQYEAINLGLKWGEKFGDFEIDLGLFYTLSNATIKKIAENKYIEPTNIHLSKVNTDVRALRGFIFDRLFLASDFDASGNLVEGIPIPTWGQVKPGDIKYKDYNNDGSIDDNDLSIIGRNSNNSQISMNIDLKYKQWELFLLPIAQMGGQGYKNSDYYWFKGNSAKYSEVALGAFDENNPDPKASYPRLSLGSSTNNYRNSSFWLYDKSNLQLVSAQLSYKIMFKNNPYIQNLKLYVKGYNLFMIAKDKEVLELNFGSAPQSRVATFGATITF